MTGINANYLLRLANNELTDKEILKGYMQHYVAQGRSIGDMKHDYMRLRTPTKKYYNFTFKALPVESIRNALSCVRQVLDNYMIENFNCVTTDDISI